jgi:hypothetical protein
MFAVGLKGNLLVVRTNNLTLTFRLANVSAKCPPTKPLAPVTKAGDKNFMPTFLLKNYL